MTLQRSTKRNLKTILSVTAFMVACGILYPLITLAANPHAIVNGIVIGFLLGLIISTSEVYFFGRYGRRLRFSVLLIGRSVFYLAVITVTVIFVIAEHMVHVHGVNPDEAFQHPEFQRFMYGGEFLQVMLYCLVVSFAVNFIRQVNRLLGQNVLWNYLTGKYHQPKEEERIFMFLDLKSSTALAERLGHIRYHRFLNDFFFDITPAIVESQGEIYQYVGDEVVVTWTRNKGFRDANCITCYFRIAAAIHQKSDRYLERYGVVPGFKAGYHFGPVITAEIGDIRKDIVFHGDTMNTASRIRSECTRFRKDVLLSRNLMDHISIEEILTPEAIGKIRLRGKKEEIELYTIKEAA